MEEKHYECTECGRDVEEVNQGGQCFECWEKDVDKM